MTFTSLSLASSRDCTAISEAMKSIGNGHPAAAGLEDFPNYRHPTTIIARLDRAI
jgi:hypothetical protein